MKVCEAAGCEVKFIPNVHNQKYADPRCRKEQEYNIVCSHRRELNDFGVPNNPMDDLQIANEVELKLAYTKLVQEYDCLLYTSPSPRDLSTSRMPSSA